ncbi:MAG: RsmD family RNA methyltransferase [Byssovorax sp.]
MSAPRRHRGPRAPNASAPSASQATSARSSEQVTLTIDHLAPGGAGVGRLADGLVVFVPQAAPGDRLEIALDRRSKPAAGKILRVLDPGPDRAAPPCPLSARCGGCDFMHLTARAQEEGHRRIVEVALGRALPGVALPPITVHAAPRPLAYRTRARLYARTDRDFCLVGYRAAGTHDLVAIETCAVLDPALDRELAELRRILAGGRGEGDLWIARGEGGRPVLGISWKGEIAPSTWQALDAGVRTGRWAGAQVLMEGATTPASFGDPRAFMTGADGAPLVLSAGGFAQPSDEGAAALAREVDMLARERGSIEGREPIWKESAPRHIVELFAGSGTLSVLLARGAASFTAVEIDPLAAACARHNLDQRALDAKVVTAAADTYALPPRTEIVVLDPPRTGALRAASTIAASPARAVIYVACDPATMARDLAVLHEGGFALTHLSTHELFPQTSHVETVARLVRVRSARKSARAALP